MFGLMAGAFFGLGIAIAGALTLVMGGLLLVAAVVMQMPWNPAYNLFEDMILMESQLRQAVLEEETGRVSSSSSSDPTMNDNNNNNNDRDTPKALAELRAAMLESYYDALAIHLQTDTLTHGTHDPGLLHIRLHNDDNDSSDKNEEDSTTHAAADLLEEGRGI